MKSIDCDFSSMKEALKTDVNHVISALQTSLEKIEKEENHFFYELQTIKNTFSTIEMKAATYYLNCHLVPFTNKYEALSASIQNMSKKKHGGLIVIQREDHVESLIQKGVSIEAELTQALIESIFYPGNPLHDGAVLIHQDHIRSASNILPLTQSEVDVQKFGTRHRAAIGLTEKCDALALVVSEESGRVSFACEGKLFPIVMH